MAAKTILTIFHQEDSKSGRVGDRLLARGYCLEACCPAMGDGLPQSLDSYQGVISFGGAMSANDDHLPFIRAELDWLPQVIAAQVPLLGICLGAQLIARVLGGAVRSRPDELPRVGYFPVLMTAEGEARLGCPSGSSGPLSFYHWHSEGFDLAPGAVPLAQGDGLHFPAFCHGDRCYGVQFHPEATEEMIRRHAEQAGKMARCEATQPIAITLVEHERWAPPVERWIDRLLDCWLACP